MTIAQLQTRYPSRMARDIAAPEPDPYYEYDDDGPRMTQDEYDDYEDYIIGKREEAQDARYEHRRCFPEDYEY